MWWREVISLGDRLEAINLGHGSSIDETAIIEDGATLDDSKGPIIIGARTRVCAGAIIRGPVFIENDCMIGNQALIRGPATIGIDVKIGFATEVKQAIIGSRVSIGPMCFVADSKVDHDVYLGAMVRTSNQRLDRQPIKVMQANEFVSCGSDKLGCWIGAGTSIGIQGIILPGRIVPSNSTFDPRITIEKNLPVGHYRIKQALEAINTKGVS